MRITTMTAVAGTLLASPIALASPGGSVLLWNNMPEGHVAGTSMSSQMDVAVPFDSQVADDFHLDGGGVISSVRFVGGFWNGEIATDPFDFNVIFHESATDATGPAPVELGTSFLVTPTVSDNGDGTFTYAADLGVDFVAAADTTYWISFQAVLDFPPQWGIEQSATQIGAQAHAGFPLLGTDYWSSSTDAYGGAYDTAFKLYGGAIPAPSAAALLLMAGARRRRRRHG